MVLWVFGYGSIIWKAGFNYDERVIGYIKGYRRVFYQGNTDHRGTPDYPGRCVTLVRDDDAICWGAAYRVSGHDTEQLVLSYLNLREKEYDVRAYIDFYTDSPTRPALTGVLVFIGSPNKKKNKYYLGPAPIPDMASQIARAVGPSGPNYEYLFRLEEALISEIGCAEDELIELANEVRKLLGGANEVSKLLNSTNGSSAINGIAGSLKIIGCNGSSGTGSPRINGCTASSPRINGYTGSSGINGITGSVGINGSVCTHHSHQMNGQVNGALAH